MAIFHTFLPQSTGDSNHWSFVVNWSQYFYQSKGEASQTYLPQMLLSQSIGSKDKSAVNIFDFRIK